MSVLVHPLRHIRFLVFVIVLLILGFLASIYYSKDASWGVSHPVLYSQTDTTTANQIIEKSRLGSIRREFPDEMLEKTLEELENLARQTQNSEVAKKAKKALKLLKDGRFKKP